MTVSAQFSDLKGYGMRPKAKMDSAERGEIMTLRANAESKYRYGNLSDAFKDLMAAHSMAWAKVPVGSDGYPTYKHPRIPDLRINSILRKDEWEELDRAVVEESHNRMNAIQRLIDQGLVQRLGGPGTLISQWNTITEMTRASVTVEGVTKTDMDLVDHKLQGVTIPVIHKRFDLSVRTLDASRNLGDGVDLTNATEATRVVEEEWERMFFAGNTGVNLNGNPIWGVTTETNINTGAATGDFGTISNIYPTFLAMVNAIAGDNYHGPIDFWVATTQFNEMQNRFTDGSGQTALEAVKIIQQVREVFPSDWMTAGTLVGVTMLRDVIDVALTQTPTLVEWMSPDGMMAHFKVIAIGAPRVKSTYAGNSGIAYYTGA